MEEERDQTAQTEENVGGSRLMMESAGEEDKVAFDRLMLELPFAVDKAREKIIKDIARRNNLGYTIVVGFFSCAVLESIAVMLIEEISLDEPSTIEIFFWTLVTIWSYNAGFAWSYLFPRIFGAGTTNLPCSGQVSGVNG